MLLDEEFSDEMFLRIIAHERDLWKERAEEYERIIEQLKPCPFCGGEAAIVSDERRISGDLNQFGKCVICKDCFCSTRIYGNKAKDERLAAAWNRRISDD